MKSLLRKLLPQKVVNRYRQYVRRLEQRRNSRRSTEQVFTDIYEKNKWGGRHGEFNSGDGTTDDSVVSPYVAALRDLATREGFRGQAFVDLGCGDFRVGRQLLPLCSSYIGVDIVKPLIERNSQEFGSATTQFLHRNIVEDELPRGDVCMIRQVLQHLSNQQILAILNKVRQFRTVIITEHYPTDNAKIVPNLDKVSGGDIRVFENSGVYLTKPPFNLPDAEVSLILEVPGAGLGSGNDPGVIRTYLYRPQKGIPA